MTTRKRVEDLQPGEVFYTNERSPAYTVVWKRQWDGGRNYLRVMTEEREDPLLLAEKRAVRMARSEGTS